MIQQLGSLTSVVPTASGIIGKTTCGQFSVAIFQPQIIQVRITQSETFDDFSYSVTQSPGGEFTLEDDKEHIRIKTSALVLVISKASVMFTFYDQGGNLLNQDEPGLGTSWINNQVTAYKRLQEGERFIGLGEKTGPLDRRGHGYQNWNTDAYSYNSGTDPLYCSMPFYVGLHHQLQYGIYLDNTHQTHFNFGASNDRFSSFSAEGGPLNYYFIAGNSVAEIINHYTWLTGRMPLPPKWSLGYQQCRYSYYPSHEVTSLASTFRDKQIPADVIVLDIHYMDKYKIFTWDQRNFQKPEELIALLRKQNFEVVLMCDPGIKKEAGYEPYDDGIASKVFLTYPDGQPYTGQVWPGWCHFPDFTRTATRAWWKKKLKAYTSLGVNGYWNDMNEIATWGNMLPDHIIYDFEGRKTTSREARNVYGFQMARSTYEAAVEQLEGRRPFNLTRSGFSGVQRYAAVWTGDNVSYDEHMLLGVRLVNSLGLTGVAFAGYDIGGFVGEANTKLFARWISLGALSPFFRGHTMINTRDAEPWSFGEEVEQISRNYIRFRYQLMPYLYSTFEVASRTGMPVQRTLAITHTHDQRTYLRDYHNQYFLGPSILVAPVESLKEFVKVFLPAGQWYALYDGKKLEGDQEVIVEAPIHKLPVFVQAGAILPMQPPVQHTRETVDELRVHVYAGPAETSFELYEDDGATFAYQQGKSCKRTIRYKPWESRLEISEPLGGYESPFRKLKLILHGFPSTNQVHVNGTTAAVRTAQNDYFLPLEKYDPINEPDSMGNEQVQIIECQLKGSVTMEW